MLIHNSKELKLSLLPKIKQAVQQTQMQIYDIIDKVLMDYYNDYSPEQYHRTYQLLRSLVRSNIEETSNGYKASVYFDYQKLHYKSSWSGKKTMENAGKKGIRGYKGKNHSIPIRSPKIWLDPKTEIDGKVIKMLIVNLKAVGIPIKK